MIFLSQIVKKNKTLFNHDTCQIVGLMEAGYVYIYIYGVEE